MISLLVSAEFIKMFATFTGFIFVKSQPNSIITIKLCTK